MTSYANMDNCVRPLISPYQDAKMTYHVLLRRHCVCYTLVMEVMIKLIIMIFIVTLI